MQQDHDLLDALRTGLAAVLYLVEELVLDPPTSEQLAFLKKTD